MISTFTNREEKRNFRKIFLFLSNEYQLSSPSLLLAIYGINYCQTNLYVCLLESTPLFHFSSFLCVFGVSFSCLHLCYVLMEAIIIILGMLYKCRGTCCLSTLRKDNIQTFWDDAWSKIGNEILYILSKTNSIKYY